MLKSTEKNGAACIAARFYAPAFIAARLSYIQLLPLAAKKYSTLPKKRAAPTTLEQSQKYSRASLFHSSSVTMLLHKASSYNNFMCIKMYNVVVCSPESIVPVL